MQGHIRQRGKSSWEIRWYAGTDESTGRKRYKTKSIRGTSKDAEKALRAILSSIDTGTYIEPTKMSVAEGLEIWLDYIRDNISARTAQEYGKVVTNYLIPKLGKHRLEDLTPFHIQSYYGKALKSGGVKGGALSPQTVKHHHRILKQGLQYLVDMEFLGRNPAKAVKPPKVEAYEAQTLSPEEFLILLNAARDSKYFVPILISAFTACRRGEVLGLQWTDVDFDNATISIERSLEQTREFGLRLKQPKTK